MKEYVEIETNEFYCHKIDGDSGKLIGIGLPVIPVEAIDFYSPVFDREEKVRYKAISVKTRENGSVYSYGYSYPAVLICVSGGGKIIRLDDILARRYIYKFGGKSIEGLFWTRKEIIMKCRDCVLYGTAKCYTAKPMDGACAAFVLRMYPYYEEQEESSEENSLTR